MVDTVPKPASYNPNTTAAVSNAIKLPAQGVLMTGSLNWTKQVRAYPTAGADPDFRNEGL